MDQQARGNEPVAALDWASEGRDWPLRAHSRFVDAAGLRWHVQQLGAGPPLLLLHGTGSATHSWRSLAPLLARDWQVTSLDLPGHAFTAGAPAGGLSLPGMSSAVAGLLDELGVRPKFVVGHSAGAAIACRMALDGRIAPQLIVSLNGALLPMQGAHWQLFAPLARLLATTSLTAKLFAWTARDPLAVQRLVASTGSRLEPADLARYAQLVRNPGHVDGTLRMMANWDLATLARDLPRLRVPLALVVGGGDRTVPPAEARRVQSLLPRASLLELPGLGHLAHEEAAPVVAEALRALVAGPGQAPGQAHG
jgi:magnesium chelatase accessory protein